MDDVLISSPVASLIPPWGGDGAVDLAFPIRDKDPQILITLYGGKRGHLATRLLTRRGSSTWVTGLATDQLLTAVLVDLRSTGSSVACGPYVLADLITALPNAGSSGGTVEEPGSPARFSGTVTRVEDNLQVPASRKVVAIEKKDDGWIVSGHVTSDSETGDYQLDVETFGGESFIICMDDYGLEYPADQFVAVGTRIHPTIPNGFVYRVEQAGTLPVTEPEWWIDSGTNHTRTVDDVTLRALPFFRPLCHGPVMPDTV